MKQQRRSSSAQKENGNEERVGRIIAASLEVFSEFSFRDATTGEIARRARVSKRDIYAHFPDKHALLTATVNRALQTEINRVRSTIVSTRDMSSLQERLELIGQTLINEVLSVTMSVLTRLVASESINRPLLGTVYFENGPVRRTELISELLSGHIADATMKNSLNTFQAAEHYLALVTDQPRLATLIGMQDRWDITSIQPHVETSVECFLRAYPVFN